MVELDDPKCLNDINSIFVLAYNNYHKILKTKITWANAQDDNTYRISERSSWSGESAHMRRHSRAFTAQIHLVQI